MNKPVAIVELGGEVTWLTDVLPYKAKLYTHPVKELTLTDEEIAVIWANYGVPMTGMDFKKVVEAILQKANNG